MSRFVKQQYDDYENQDKHDPTELQRIMKMYKSVFGHVFDSEDIYTFNNNIVDEYTTLLVKHQLFEDAIAARNQLINYLVKQGEIDHQMRRAYVELVLLVILRCHKHKLNPQKELQDALNQFVKDTPNPMVTDEFQIADQIRTAISGDNSSDGADWPKVQALLKKPLFNFLNNEMVKQVKLAVMEAVENQEALQTNKANQEVMANKELTVVE